jgi:hypothetical protein
MLNEKKKGVKLRTSGGTIKGPSLNFKTWIRDNG